ncbi:hypothetical protein [Rheinheimera gaetbuli]
MTLFCILIRKELLDASHGKRSVMAGLNYALGTPDQGGDAFGCIVTLSIIITLC